LVGGRLQYAVQPEGGLFDFVRAKTVAQPLTQTPPPIPTPSWGRFETIGKTRYPSSWAETILKDFKKRYFRRPLHTDDIDIVVAVLNRHKRIS
jgi:hypothetical protein